MSLQKKTISNFYTAKIKGGKTLTTRPDTDTCVYLPSETC